MQLCEEQNRITFIGIFFSQIRIIHNKIKLICWYYFLKINPISYHVVVCLLTKITLMASPKRMNFRKSSKRGGRGGHFRMEKLYCKFPLYWGYIWYWNCTKTRRRRRVPNKSAIWLSENENHHNHHHHLFEGSQDDQSWQRTGQM